MKQIIECVPNISEGKDKTIINEIIRTTNDVENASVVDIDSGYDTNRTVVTIIGEPIAVIECAFNIIKKSSEVIDLNNHIGTHPRMGSTDVCPIIPVSNISMDECIKLSIMLAEKVYNKLKIPVFLYEKSATSNDRINLANIRQGEFELMHNKIKEKKWKPDYGLKEIHPTSGVIAIGARNYLIAYNVNLNTMDKKIASDIALDIREAGRAKRDSKGKIIRSKNGQIVKVPGSLKATKAVGWFLDEYQISQVSMNLIDYNITSIHTAFEKVRSEARKRGVRVTGSEIVGLVPKKAILDAGKYYLKKQNKTSGIPENDIIHVAISSLGLNDITDFNLKEKIIENLIIDKSNNLSSMKINDFLDLLSTNSPAPGGGSISALSGAISASLISMVANLTIENKNYVHVKQKMESISIKAQFLKDHLNKLINDDTEAFNQIMEAFKLSKKTKNDIENRNKQIELATKKATEVPLKTLELILETINLSIEVMEHGNINSFSDAGVSAEIAISGAKSAIMNVKINLKDINDKKYVLSKKSIINKNDKKINKLILIIRNKIDKTL